MCSNGIMKDKLVNFFPLYLFIEPSVEYFFSVLPNSFLRMKFLFVMFFIGVREK